MFNETIDRVAVGFKDKTLTGECNEKQKDGRRRGGPLLEGKS